MDVISKRVKLGVWDWSRMKDLLKIFQMVTDFVYFLLSKRGYYKDPSFFKLVKWKNSFFLSIIKRFKSSENLSKSMTLQKPLKKSVIWAVSGVLSSICSEITTVVLRFVLV